MEFQNDKSEPIDINFQNFEAILTGAQFGLIPVKLKNGKVEWIRTTEEEILKAVAEE